jgi:hypothetical protein
MKTPVPGLPNLRTYVVALFGSPVFNIVTHCSHGNQVAVKLVALLICVPEFRAEILAKNTVFLREVFLSLPQSLQANITHLRRNINENPILISSWVWRRVVWPKFKDVSKERIVSVFKVSK